MTHPSDEEAVARAIAFFESSSDADLLRGVLRSIQPRAAAAARRFAAKTPPDPATLAPAAVAATQDEALATADSVQDFALLQALARAVGRRIEVLRSRN
jgi:hypothetical protein